MDQIVTLMPLILLIVIMYFLLIRPQKKREKAVAAMRNAIKVGDEVITIGGICGKIVKTKDEVLTIQVGADKTKFEIMRWAISKVVTDEPVSPSRRPRREEPEEEAQEEAPKKTLPKRFKKTEGAPAGEAPEAPAEEPAKTETVEESETVEDPENKE
jgi:preprotein translocase subunit YajC